MSVDVRLEYDELPSVAPSYLRAAITFSGVLSAGQTVPQIVATVEDVTVRAERLARYRKVCGFTRSASLPVTYPHVLAFPLHMTVLTHKQFPLKLLGLIHMRNAITQHRAIGVDEPLDLSVSVGGHRDTFRGIEFDLVTHCRGANGETIWEAVGTMLSRRSSKPEHKAPQDKAAGKRREGVELDFVPEHDVAWSVPEDIGRRYAAAAGDYNPIHLSALSAKLFGFPRAIATGMWTKAHVAAELAPQLAHDAYRLELAFKKPVFLPSRPRLQYTLGEQGADFALVSENIDKLHLSGSVRYL